MYYTQYVTKVITHTKTVEHIWDYYIIFYNVASKNNYGVNGIYYIKYIAYIYILYQKY